MVRPVMRHAMSMQSRLFASFLSAALILGPLHLAHAAPSIEDLYTQGQEAFDAGEYGNAGDKWSEAVRALEENPDNSATRQTIMNLALDAYLRAYRNDEDRVHIDKAKQLLDEYEASLEPAGGALTPEIASEKGKIVDILEDLAEAEAEANKPDPEETKPDPGNTDPEPLPPIDENPGRPLIITGAVVAGVGVAGLGLMIGGLVGGASAQADWDAAVPGSAEQDTIGQRGRTMNILAGVGGAVGGVLIGTGVALLAIGLKRNADARNQNLMLVPSLGPGYAGVGLSGRF